MSVRPRRRVALASVVLVGALLAPILGGASTAGAAATVASSSSGSSAARNSISLDRPSGTAAGHAMVAQIVSNDDDPGLVAPSGWTVVSDRSIVNALRQVVYVKVAGSTEPPSYTWTLSTSTTRRIAGGLTTYSGIDTTSPIDAAGTSVNATASVNVTAPSITTTVPGAMVVHLAAINTEGTLSAPAGMTERWEATSPNGGNSRDALASASDAIQAPAGATGVRTATGTLSGANIATLLALRPSGPPPPPDTTAPVTTITSGPTGTVASSFASFTFSADEPAAFQCRLDGAAFTSCASPKSYSGLANGSHTFAVRAIDPSNNVGAPDSATWIVDAPLSDPVLVGAGDIAGCGQTNDSATAALLDNIPGTVFTTGDNVYNDGTATQFNNCYDPAWGRHKARTRPSPGNHDYQTGNANGYFGYFGAAAGDPSEGYYDYTLSEWHVIVLNSNCGHVGGCGEGSPQMQWLRSVLAASSAPCTAAIWHHTRFSSGARKGNDPTYVPFWQALYDHGADVVINGHDHLYERFGLQDPLGNGDPAFGIRQFTVGTGGAGHYEFGTTKPNSERRNADTFGVLKLTLHATSYDWQFVPVAGKTFTDSGTAACHGAPTTTPPPPPPPVITGIARTDGAGYWLAATDGRTFPFGDAAPLGSLPTPPNPPIIAIAGRPDGAGYWLVNQKGALFPFGAAGSFGSTASITLNRPIVGMASTPSGNGYWLVASDGGIFAFGDAAFRGSTGNIKLNQPIVGMASTPSGNGYWFVASDGGIFAFGDASFLGSLGGMPPSTPVVDMAATPTGSGYWLALSDGQVFDFGAADPLAPAP
jgi:hypothetical protein